MILCLDCGNTSIKIGLFEDDTLVKVLDDYLQQARNKEGDDEDAEEY